MGENATITKQDGFKLDLLEVIKKNPGISQTKLFDGGVCDTKTTNTNNLNFLLYIKAIRNEPEKKNKKSYHHYFINPLGEAILYKQSGYILKDEKGQPKVEAKLETWDDMQRERQELKKKIKPIPNSEIGDFIRLLDNVKARNLFNIMGDDGLWHDKYPVIRNLLLVCKRLVNDKFAQRQHLQDALALMEQYGDNDKISPNIPLVDLWSKMSGYASEIDDSE